MLDELVMVVASPRTKELLVDYAEHNKVQQPPFTRPLWLNCHLSGSSVLEALEGCSSLLQSMGWEL